MNAAATLDLEYAAKVLGLPLPAQPQEPRRKAKATAHVPGRTIVLSVRRKDSSGAPYGNPVSFTHTAGSVFRTTALIEAERAARAAGYVPWVILDDGDNP